MSVSKLPSVESLVNRIKNRIKYPQIVKNKEPIKYYSPVKQLHDEQIADMPALVWDNENNFHQANKHQKIFYENKDYHQDEHYNQMNKQTVRNLGYCEAQRDIPRVPHRKQEGNLMKTLIYDAHYADHPLNQPVPVNYDYEYAKHERKYVQTKSEMSNYYKGKSRSVIGGKVERDRLSGKNYPKFMN